MDKTQETGKRATREEIIYGLQCTSEPGGGECKGSGCPYFRAETLIYNGKPEQWTDCDIDRISRDAAEMLEADEGREATPKRYERTSGKGTAWGR